MSLQVLQVLQVRRELSMLEWPQEWRRAAAAAAGLLLRSSSRGSEALRVGMAASRGRPAYVDACRVRAERVTQQPQQPHAMWPLHTICRICWVLVARCVCVCVCVCVRFCVCKKYRLQGVRRSVIVTPCMFVEHACMRTYCIRVSFAVYSCIFCRVGLISCMFDSSLQIHRSVSLCRMIFSEGTCHYMIPRKNTRIHTYTHTRTHARTHTQKHMPSRFGFETLEEDASWSRNMRGTSKKAVEEGVQVRVAPARNNPRGQRPHPHPHTPSTLPPSLPHTHTHTHTIN
jgi:hypothetical protein